MKKKIILIPTILLSAAVLSLSSCLKDSRYVDFSKGGSIVEFPTGGQVHFSGDAVTASGDTIVQQFAVSVASVTVPTTSTTVTFSVDDPAVVTAYVLANPAVSYLPVPANAYVYTQTSVTIPGGQRSAILTVTFYKNRLDPSKSYMLPIAIKSAGGLNISGNMGTHYYHFIGNDFAGAYEHYFDRWSVADTTVASQHGYNHVDEGAITASPITPTEFVVNSSYYTGIPMHVTFTKTGTGATATYSNFNVFITAADIANYFTPGGVVLATQPTIRSLHFNYDPNQQYTYAQSLLLFRFYYTTASRAVIDDYVHL